MAELGLGYGIAETSVTTGTASYVLQGALTRSGITYRSFQGQVASGTTVEYAAFDGTNLEIVRGVYTESGGTRTLSRATIIFSTNSNNAISWSAGTRTIELIIAGPIRKNAAGNRVVMPDTAGTMREYGLPTVATTLLGADTAQAITGKTSIVMNDSDLVGATGSITASSGDSGVTSPNAAGDDLLVESSNNAGMTIASSNSGTGNIFFADPDNSGAGRIVYNHNGDLMAFQTAGVERFRLDDSGRGILGGGAAQTVGSTATFQVNSTSSANGLLLSNWANGNAPPLLIFGISRSGVVGSHTIVQSGDVAMRQRAYASDGSAFVEMVRIDAVIDATPGSNDMPGRLSFATTSDGAAFTTERLRLDSGGAAYFPTIGTTASAANAHLNSGSSPANSLLRSTSSLRYKDVVGYLDEMQDFDPWAIINASRGFIYKSLSLNDHPDREFYGFGAEDQYEIEPRLVEMSIDPDTSLPRPESYHYDRHVVVLNEALRRLHIWKTDIDQRLAAANI